MQYEIFSGETLINTIEADEVFCQVYCEENGYTYRLRDVQNQKPLTDIQKAEQEITFLHQEKIALGQEITELKLNQLEGGATANA